MNKILKMLSSILNLTPEVFNTQIQQIYNMLQNTPTPTVKSTDSIYQYLNPRQRNILSTSPAHIPKKNNNIPDQQKREQASAIILIHLPFFHCTHHQKHFPFFLMITHKKVHWTLFPSPPRKLEEKYLPSFMAQRENRKHEWHEYNIYAKKSLTFLEGSGRKSLYHYGLSLEPPSTFITNS